MSGLGWYHWLWIAVLLLILFRWMTRMARGVPRAATGQEPSSSRRSSNLVFANTNQQLESVVHGRQGLPPYTSRGGMEVSPSYIDYMAGYPPEPPPSWAPPSPYSRCAPPPHVGGLPPQQSHGRQSLSQLDVGALPTYEEAMRVQPMKTEFSNSNSA